MIKLILPLLALLVPGSAAADAPADPYRLPGIVWQLETLDGAALRGIVTLSFPQEGKLSGRAPCNAYFGEQTAAYPGFLAGALGMTKMACIDLGFESEFFSALQAMRHAAMEGDRLTLTDDTGRRMIFTAAQ